MRKLSTSSEDNDEENPSMHKVSSCLKDADMYDGALSNEEMLQIYKVLTLSKTTATAEDEHRRILEETDQNCDMIDQIRLHSVPVETSSDKSVFEDCEQITTTADISDDETVVSNSQEKLNDFDEVDVFNSVPTTHPPLPRITYKPKYRPPVYCTSKFLRLSLAERVRVLSEYHKKLIDIYDRHQRQSPYYAPLGKPILADSKFNVSLLKSSGKDVSFEFNDDSNDMLEQDDNLSEVYITKTGRQTKRKLYSEYGGDEKKIKTNPCDEPTSSSQPKKRPNFRTMKNGDIMKKSKLFADFSTSRSEKLFDTLIDSQKKEEEDGKVREKFLNSLELSNDDDFVDPPIAEKSEVPFITKRRVPPPTGVKKQAKARARNNKPKENDIKKTTEKKSLPTYNELEVTTVTSSNAAGMGTCPICNLSFQQDQLESHADECLDHMNNEANPTDVSPAKHITCEKCDAVLPFDMDYEIHVTECLSNLTP